jgi:tetraacyldisaccharide 4'-kinase
MRLEAPGWWYGRTAGDRAKALLLSPVGAIYGLGVRARFALAKPYRSKLPVICIGNFTVGGAGKTPLALAVSEMLREVGHSPAFLTRGFGGRIAGPHRVDPSRDGFEDVGDEALLLARSAPTIVARNRADGARAIEETGASIIVMDDGFQNPSLVKDLSLIVVDAGSGLGNGLIFPAGPLRASLRFQTERADAVIIVGEAGPANIPELDIPLFRASLEPAGDCEWLRTQPVLAFCGIGRPQKFFDTLNATGAAMVSQTAFPDHHPYTDSDARSLLEQAETLGAQLVTTEKDWVRLKDAGALGELKASSRSLPVKLSFSADEKEKVAELLRGIAVRNQ